jgi:uncharacterized membrane protein
MARRLLAAAQEERILTAIRDAEAQTSGEIRVHLQAHADGDIMAAARSRFEALGMTATAARNGVLIFVGIDDRRFAILGDRGIDEKVPPGFWDAAAAAMGERFRQGDLAEGVAAGVAEAGNALAQWFPRTKDDVNELSDEISRG